MIPELKTINGNLKDQIHPNNFMSTIARERLNQSNLSNTSVLRRKKNVNLQLLKLADQSAILNRKKQLSKEKENQKAIQLHGINTFNLSLHE